MPTLWVIDPLYKSHNGPAPYPTVHMCAHFCYKMVHRECIIGFVGCVYSRDVLGWGKPCCVLSAPNRGRGGIQPTTQYYIVTMRPLPRYVKLRVAHAPGMPGTFFPPPWVSDSDMHHGTCVTHVPWCMPGSLTSGFLWSRWRGTLSRNSRHMYNLQFYVSDKMPIRPMRPISHPTWTGPNWQYLVAEISK